MTRSPSPASTPLPEHVDRLADGSRRLIARLAELGWAGDLYLAGSAALTLYLGHRRVRDLDVMGYRRLASAERRDLLRDFQAIDDGVRVETARDGFFSLRFSDAFGGAGLRLFYYPYPLVGAEEELDGLAVASALDLGLMKLGAVISRGHRRDFLDVFLLSEQIPFETMLERADDKYGHVRDIRLQALKGLADVASARTEPMPRLDGRAVEWSDVERWIVREVRPVARRELGLGDDR